MLYWLQCHTNNLAKLYQNPMYSTAGQGISDTQNGKRYDESNSIKAERHSFSVKEETPCKCSFHKLLDQITALNKHGEREQIGFGFFEF